MKTSTLFSWLFTEATVTALANNEQQQPAASVVRQYTWRPDLKDMRDHLLAYSVAKQQQPVSVDLRPKMPPVYEQGALGSCTANAIAAAYEYDEMRQHEAPDQQFVPSRLFIYYNERYAENDVKKDHGASLRDGMKSVAKQGVCPESMWPYEIANFTRRPSAECYRAALCHRAVEYKAVSQNLDQLKHCLANGSPIIFGFTVYASFESPKVAQTGIMSMPTPDDKLLGGHAVLAVGYDDESQTFCIRNSWGTDWGDNGHFYMPYEYILTPQLATNFWVLQRVCDKYDLFQ